MPATVPQWPPVPNPRLEKVTLAIKDAVARYACVLETDAPIRAMTIEVKMRDDGLGVRAVLVSFQGETDQKSR